LEILIVRSFIRNDEDFESSELKDYFYRNCEEKINVSVQEINVNRIPDKTKDFYFRYD